MTGWALRSKHPGRAMGYTLLGTSGDEQQADRLIEAAITGTPSAENAGRADGLPWLSFVADVAASPVLGVVERSWSTERDGTGQTIVPSRLLTVPWPTEPLCGPGFLSLYDASGQADWPTVDGDPSGLPPMVAPWDHARAARDIDQVGFGWVLDVAGTLLDGHQVVITTPEQLSVGWRLRLLDCICALLPYGCRSWISAGTWADDLTEHPVRLTFAHRERSHQRVFHFAQPTDQDARSVRLSVAAADYCHELRTLIQTNQLPTATVVEHLARLHEPLAEGQTVAALHHLRELRLADAVHEEVLAGHGEPDRVDRVLQLKGWHGLEPRQRADFGQFLAERARSSGTSVQEAQKTQAILRRRWARDLVHALVDAIVATAEGHEPERAAGILIGVSESVDLAQLTELVSATVAWAARSAADDQRGSQVLGAVLTSRTLLPQESPSWQHLAAVPRLGLQVLTTIGANNPEFREAILLLSRQPGTAWLAPIYAIECDGRIELGGGPVDRDVLELVMRIAIRRKQFVPFLSAAPHFVLSIAYRDPPSPRARGTAEYPDARRVLEHVLAERDTPITTTAGTAAKDLLHLGVMQTLPALRRGDEGLVAALAAAWRGLPPRAGDFLAARLPLAVLDGQFTAASIRRLAAVTEEFASPKIRKQALSVLAEELTRRADALGPLLELDEAWLHDLVTSAPQHRWLVAYSPLAEVARGTPPASANTVADMYHRFRERGGPASAGIQAIKPWLQSNPPGEICEVLWELAFTTSGHRHNFSQDRLAREIAHAILSGELGERLARTFDEHVATRASAYSALAALNDAAFFGRGRSAAGLTRRTLGALSEVMKRDA